MYPAVHAQTTPDKPAVIMGSGEVVTYRQLNDRSNQCAQLFASLGLVKDDAIALFMMNCPEFFYAAWGHTWLMTGARSKDSTRSRRASMSLRRRRCRVRWKAV